MGPRQSVKAEFRGDEKTVLSGIIDAVDDDDIKVFADYVVNKQGLKTDVSRYNDRTKLKANLGDFSDAEMQEFIEMVQ